MDNTTKTNIININVIKNPQTQPPNTTHNQKPHKKTTQTKNQPDSIRNKGHTQTTTKHFLSFLSNKKTQHLNTLNKYL